MDHFEEEENFPLEAKQARICFAGCRYVPPPMNGTATSVASTAIGLEEQAWPQRALAAAGVAPKHFCCDPSSVFKNSSSGEGEKRGVGCCGTS